MTDEQRRELQTLYSRLAKHWGWPLPETWLADRDTIVGDVESALICLRAVVAEQCPIVEPVAHTHWAFTPESEARAKEMKEAA